MIAVSGVSMRYGSKVLFDEVSTTFSAGRRYGLTGPNGAGKSTFMKLLSGDLQPQKGSVSRPARLGILRQDQFAFDAHRVVDTVIMGNAVLWSALEERDRLYAKPTLSDEDGMRLGELEGIIGEHDGYSAESDAAILLAGLDIPDALARADDGRAAGRPEGARPAGAGAVRAPGRAAPRRADQPPRPRLDPLAARVPGPLRRDAGRHLARPPLPERGLSRTSPTSTTRRSSPTPAATTTWSSPRRRSASRLESQNEQREKKIEQLNDFIARFSAGTRSSQVQSRRKEVERLQTTDLARSNIQRPFIRFQMLRPSGRMAFECADVTKTHGGNAVVAGFEAIVNRGEKIVLVGRNGLGKTTLLKALLADAPSLDASPARARPRLGALGPRGVDRLLPAGSHRARSRRA